MLKVFYNHRSLSCRKSWRLSLEFGGDPGSIAKPRAVCPGWCRDLGVKGVILSQLRSKLLQRVFVPLDWTLIAKGTTIDFSISQKVIWSNENLVLTSIRNRTILYTFSVYSNLDTKFSILYFLLDFSVSLAFFLGCWTMIGYLSVLVSFSGRVKF